MGEGVDVAACGHITGGGIAANLARVLPPGTGAVLDRATWRPLPIFTLLATRGGIGSDEMERVFNMGIGMTAVVNATGADRALHMLTERGIPAWPAGEVTQDAKGTRLAGTYQT